MDFELGLMYNAPTVLLDGDRVVKKFRRRRRLGVLVTSNAALVAARKAALSGFPMTVSTTYKTPQTIQKRVISVTVPSSISTSSPASQSLSFTHPSKSSRAAPITSRGKTPLRIVNKFSIVIITIASVVIIFILVF